MTDDEAIHQAHCTEGTCTYRDPQCPVAVEPLAVHSDGKTRAGLALAELVEETALGEEYAVRSVSEDWVYALPRIIPKALYGKRGTLEAARWHREKLAWKGEGTAGLEIIRRVVGKWEVVDG
jgi:hypothetical protein